MNLKPSDLGLPAKFREFRRYPGFDQFATALDLATSPERFQVLNAATGSGKSATYATVAALRRARWLVLVGTKGLQSQLLDDGIVRRLAYGHRNYPCMSRVGFGDSDTEPDDPEFRCAVPRDRCTWLGDIEAASVAQSVVANYAFWLSIGRFSKPDMLGEFDFLVLDEAHTAPGWLVNALTINMSSGRLRRVLDLNTWPKLPNAELVEGWHSWAVDTLAKAYDRAAALGKEARSERRKIERLVQDLQMLVRVSDPEEFADAGYREPWIVVPDADNGSVKFAPRWGSDFAEQYLFRDIPNVLLTSATITQDHLSYLGIKPPQAKFREVPSPFDSRRRPVIWVPTTRVDFRMSEGAKYKLHRRVDELVEAAIDQQAGNGIIHTGSYDRMRELAARSRYGAAIITHRQDSKDFAAALEKFKQAGREGKFAIIASPRMQEGVDLPDDLARWQIILKCPFPDSRDPLTKARMTDAKYRSLVVMETITQMVGRPVRNADDYAVTWILDNHWGDHVLRQCPFAGWFRAACKTVREDVEGGFQFLTQEVIGRLKPLKQVEMIG